MASEHTNTGNSKRKSGKKANKSVQQNEEPSANGTEQESDPDMFSGVHRSILEAFDALDWNKSLKAARQESFRNYWIPPDAKSVSYAMKLIDNKFSTFPSEAVKLQPLPEDSKEVKKFVMPGLPFNHQTMFPRASVLGFKEQHQLYQFYYRMSSRTVKPMTDEELTKFQELRSKVSEEYAEFQEFAKNMWCKEHWKRVLPIPPQVEQFIDNLWKIRTMRCLNIYPDEYKTVRQIPLSLHDPHQDFSVFETVTSIYRESFPLKMRLVSTKEPTALITDLEHLCRIKPITDDFRNRLPPILTTILPVSLDRHVDNILKQDNLDVDVVISMSGIKAIVGNFKPYQREWILPITVKEVLKNDGETVKKVVIIDKKLPPQSMSVHEKNLWHAKIVAKWVLIKSECPDIFAKKEQTPESMVKQGESFEDMLSDVAKKIKEAKEAEGEETNDDEIFKKPYPPPCIEREEKPESSRERCEPGTNWNKPESSQVSGGPGTNRNKPVASSSQPVGTNNLGARAAGGRALTSYSDLSDFGTPVNDDEPKKLQTSTGNLNRQQKKKEPSSVKSHWAGFVNPLNTNQSQSNTVDTRKRERKRLSYDDPFSDVVQDFEEFGFDPAPSKSLQNRHNKSKETDTSSTLDESSLANKMKAPSSERGATFGNCRKNSTDESKEPRQITSRQKITFETTEPRQITSRQKITFETTEPEEITSKEPRQITSRQKITFETAEPGEITLESEKPCSLRNQRFSRDPKFGLKKLNRPCLHYHIWNLHKSKYIQFLKAEQRSLNVLVRTRRDGTLVYFENPSKKVVEEVCVSSKVEFQPEFGATKMAADDLIKEYLDLYMRPAAKLVRVRSIGHTKEVMMTELKTIGDIKQALSTVQSEGREINKLFDPLYSVLTKLIDLPPGRYMLRHTVKDAAFATLLMEAPGRGVNFNLQEYCQELQQAEVSAPPMAIDTVVLTALQHRDKLPPALFHPCYQTPEYQSCFFAKPTPEQRKTIKRMKKKRNDKMRKEKKKEKKKEIETSNEKDQPFDSVDSLGLDSLWP